MKGKKKVVDFFNKSSFSNSYDHTYIIKFHNTIPKKCNLSVHFPDHPKDALKTLCVQKYRKLNSLNIELNTRFKACMPSGDLVVGNFEFKNIVGTVYLVWATINKQNVNNIEVNIYHDSPVLVVKDGYHQYRNIFLFDDMKSKQVYIGCDNDFQTHVPLFSNLWCCESLKRVEAKNKIPKLIIIHENESTNIIENEVHVSKRLTLDEIMTDIDKTFDGEDDDNNNNNNIEIKNL